MKFRHISSILLLILAVVIAAGCSCSGNREVAVLETDLGRIVIGFYPGDAPRHVDRFKELAGSGFYDGLLVHRVIPDFVIQSGDPLTRDPNVPRSKYGSGGTGVTLEHEFNVREHKRGIVGMSRTADPLSQDSLFYDTADSQFYVCLSDKPHLNGKYTAIGEVLEGMDVVDSISRVERDALNVPITPIAVKSVTIRTLRSLKRKLTDE